MSPTTAFTVGNAAQAYQLWHFSPETVSGNPAPKLEASPTVVGSRVYIGSEAGMFYALRAATGKVVWKRQLDVDPALTCRAQGISATAAVIPDPTTGVLTVYVAGARDLYALDAATGAVIWQTMIGPPDPPDQNASYNWSSPTVAAGHIYMGLSSRCDNPLVRGGVEELDQHTGAVLNTWYTVPAGSIGGSVWSSVAVSSAGTSVWVSTGNECDPTINTCPAGSQVGDSNSIVHLSGNLTRLSAWQAVDTLGSGQDSDFGSSPALFGGGSLPATVGACNKNGSFYSLARSGPLAAPLWTDAIGAPAGSLGSCLASAVWNASAARLYISGDGTTISGTTYGGSVREVDPATGSYIWELGLPCSVMGTPSVDSSGVLAVATRNGCTGTDTPSAYLIDSGTGAILATLDIAGSPTFAQPVFAGGNLYIATESQGLYAFAP